MYNQPIAEVSLIGCPHCDLLKRLPGLAAGASARWACCNEELWRRREDSPDNFVEPNSAQSQQLGKMLVEISRAARSVPELADYLERHPETLVRGKKGEPK
jgi:hypothetical protein